MYRNVSTYTVFCHTHNDRLSLILLQTVHNVPTAHECVSHLYFFKQYIMFLLPMSASLTYTSSNST